MTNETFYSVSGQLHPLIGFLTLHVHCLQVILLLDLLPSRLKQIWFSFLADLYVHVYIKIGIMMLPP